MRNPLFLRPRLCSDVKRRIIMLLRFCMYDCAYYVNAQCDTVWRCKVHVDTFGGSIYLFRVFHNEAYRVVVKRASERTSEQAHVSTANPTAIRAIKILFSCVRIRGSIARLRSATFVRRVSLSTSVFSLGRSTRGWSQLGLISLNLTPVHFVILVNLVCDHEKCFLFRCRVAT